MFGGRVIAIGASTGGVVLTGDADNGTAGLSAVVEGTGADARARPRVEKRRIGSRGGGRRA